MKGLSILRHGIIGIVCACMITLSQCSEALPQQQPNILFAIADDWSWPHASVFGALQDFLKNSQRTKSLKVASVVLGDYLHKYTSERSIGHPLKERTMITFRWMQIMSWETTCQYLSEDSAEVDCGVYRLIRLPVTRNTFASDPQNWPV